MALPWPLANSFPSYLSSFSNQKPLDLLETEPPFPQIQHLNRREGSREKMLL
ncbi:hypothetical protein COLO4_20124 [Corchorus olitorius]|uniref:Uncharacterized protein n=1 Tax=Corchorus olitorius TaxID=93759 RepID=A0A1R3J1M8_9ROSI|nr:hypothetical protein COLO4_20124 [Corchorus olitorius]